MTTSCKKASELLSKTKDGVKLSFLQKLSLKFHMMMCGVCKKYCRQMDMLNDFCAKYLNAVEKFEPTENQKMSDDCKQRIQQKIKEESQ